MRNWVVQCLVGVPALALTLAAPPAAAQYLKDFTYSATRPSPTAVPPPQFMAPLRPPVSVNAEALLAAADATAQRLRTGNAAWRLTVLLPGKRSLTADVLHTPPARRLVYTLHDPQHGNLELARVIETADAWYVTEGDSHRKYRPYEAEFAHPIVCYLRERAQLRLVTPEDVKGFAQPVARDARIARFLVPAPNPYARREMLAMSAGTARPPVAGNVDSPAQQREAKDRRALESGIEVDVDVALGIFTFYSHLVCPANVSRPTFDPVVGDDDLRTADRAWKPFDTDPTRDGGKDLAMLQRAGDHHGDAGSGPPQLTLLDVRNGRARRVPFRGCKAYTGCFVDNHAAVVLCGDDPGTGEPGLWLVDLRTGVNRRIGGQALAQSSTFGAALSPDGKTVAALNYADPNQLNTARIVLLDLATDRVRTIGAPQYYGGLNWLPDGTGLILARYVDPDTFADVCRVSLADGEVIPLFKGGEPVVLPGNNPRIVYYYQKNGWETRTLDGADPRPVAPDLRRLRFLTPNPDGTRLFMIKGDDGEFGFPFWVDLATGKTNPIPVDRGGWGRASWR